MKVKTFYSASYETGSKEELEQLTQILPPLLAMYDEIHVVYRVGFDSDFVFTIDRSDMIISWMNFDSGENGEVEFDELTSEILREAFSNA